MKYIAAIDQGTTSSRCILFDHDGLPVSQMQKDLPQILPKPGWVEHDPMQIINDCLYVFQLSLKKKRIKPKDIVTLGITNQRETTVLWNKKTGIPYGNAIVWQDTRTDQICNSIKSSGAEELFQKGSGLPVATYFSGPKIRWLIDNHPDIKADLSRKEVLFGNIDSWLIWNLTGGVDGGVHVTDVTNASRTMLMNLKSLQWDHELLKLLDIPIEILPAIHPSSHEFGYFGIDRHLIPISGNLGDQQASLFGQTCFDAGTAKNTYGTGCFMLMNTGEQIVYSKNGLLTTLAYQIGDNPANYCLEGSIAITGALVQWIRDNLGLISKSDEIEGLAAGVEDNGGVYFVPAFSGLFAPYWISDARGLIIGLTRYVDKRHIARAALEATAFQTREVFDAMSADSGIHLKQLRVDGGMVKNEMLMQFQSDILNVPVIKPVVSETTALGAAYAAGLATGFWKDIDDLRINWKEDKQWIPKMNQIERENYYSTWKRAVQRTFDWHR